MLAAALVGCPPPSTAPPAPSAQNLPSAVRVERARARPAFTGVVRAGDPLAALALAADTRLSVVDNALLAALLEERLGQLGQLATVRSDGLSVRIGLWLAPDAQLDPLIEALLKALQTPLGPADSLAPVAARLQGLAAEPLDHEALLPLARCGGEARTLARDIPDPLASKALRERVEQARRRGLSHDRLSLATVGSETQVDAARQALRSGGQWPHAPAPSLAPAPPQGDSADAAILYPRAAAEGRLDLALWVADPRLAAAFAAHAAPRLGAKLDVLCPGIQLDTLRATAHPAGGCVRLSLLAPNDTTPSAAAAASRLVAAELALAKNWPVAAQASLVIADTPRADDAAARAAWWALSQAAPTGTNSMTSAWGISARAEPNADLKTLQSDYREALATPPAAQPAAPQLQIETGQARVWVLVGNPCAVRRESERNAGLAALSGLMLADGETDGIRLQPFLSPNGIGVVASGPATSMDASPRWLASQVGKAAAQALMGRPDESAIESAQLRWQGLRDGAGPRAQLRLVQALLPGNPSHLLPWAGLHDVPPESTSLLARWRELALGPVRITVLAPSEEQATTAALAAEQWLLPAALQAGCGAAKPQLAAGPSAAVSNPAERWWLGARLINAQPGWAELTATWLMLDSGPLKAIAAHSSIEVELVGSTATPALIIRVRGQLPVAGSTLRDALMAAASSTFDDASMARAQALTSRRAALYRTHPVTRLQQLWAGEPQTVAPFDADAYRAWLKRVLDVKRWAFVPER